ncbi:MAG: NAD(P)(+) transhydrogenase (Re/Si-specific) subunit beta [Spirochaetia bacterium]|nr:NAD(P)(+) transhydrogenase (Re/Si-specific) subunit beta [Spirochaetia bacterium]
MVSGDIIEVFYLISTILIILGLRFLTRIERARHGNFILTFSMGLAVFVSLIQNNTSNLGWIFSALLIGSVMGILSARKVRLTSAPQLLAFFNGIGGASATITSYIAFIQLPGLDNEILFSARSIFILSSIFFGIISFSGSFIVILKLLGILPESGISFPLQKLLNFFTVISAIAVSGFILAKSEPDHYLLYLLILLSIIYGVFFFLPIGGIDSPVGISFLNSYSGLALLFSGFIYSNQMMLVGGLLIGASGLILSILFAGQSKRPVFKVLFGGNIYNSPSPYYHLGMIAKEISIIDTAIQLKNAKKVLIIPGYGLGITQTQYSVKELEEILVEFGVEVKYLVHPFAGRMPGHMNILLSEANISYKNILQVYDVNNIIHNIDLIVCVGANDIINPFVDQDKKNPLFGMPKINLEKAKQIIIIKRSLQPGFSGIENQIFFENNTSLILGNIKSSLIKLINEIREI